MSEEIPAEIRAYIGGVQAAALALRSVLMRKVAVGILSDATAQAIFEDIGRELDAAIDTLHGEDV